MTTVPDTNVVLYLLGGRLAQPLPVGAYAVSVITEIELLSLPDMRPDEVVVVQQFLSSVTLIEWTFAVRQIAIGLRRTHRLKLPDAVVAASAMGENLELLSNDERLARTPGLRCRSVAIQ